MNFARRHQPGFTLIELLVSLSIIALILAILLPALSAGRHAAQDLKCKANLRTVAEQFVHFANGDAAGTRGDSDGFGGERFYLEDFQESVYRVSEFWDSATEEREPLDGASVAMQCPSNGTAPLERRAGVPCSDGGVGPARNISVGFNMRLHRRTLEIEGAFYLRPAVLSPRVLMHSDVPLLLDVDGSAAASVESPAYFVAPPITDDKRTDPYEGGAHWFPGRRHRNKLNVAFIGGHVLSSAAPVEEPWWRWNFEPDF